ncbi:DUF3530 family protein [Catenovulum sediminis]|uniref:DUF3530 family protein n=1 Tax=Catenovulum sediminis TaxID=1740262 RepID=A0ABV1RGQ8_9ALTE|nr:DUF3530 family protein [Catenovulum sediminis]
MTKFWAFVLSVFSMFVSASLLCAAEYVMPVSQHQIASEDLLRYAPTEEIRELMAGELTFTALQSEQESNVVRGVAILLPDINLHANQTGSFFQLRYALNRYGWVSLAGVMPDFELSEKSFGEAADKESLLRPNADTQFIDEVDRNRYLDQLSLVVNAMQEEVVGYPGLILVVAQGATAGWLVEAYQAQKLPLPDALVLIAPYLPDDRLNRALPAQIAQLSVPILDVWSARDNRWALATVPLRNKASKRHLTLHYRQREMFGYAGLESREERLSKEIYGYMTYLGW